MGHAVRTYPKGPFFVALVISFLVSTSIPASAQDPNVAPVILSSAPTTATEDVAYNYAVFAIDPDSTNLVYSLAPAHTAGGSINSTTGAFTFTPAGPTPPSSVIVSVRVCDVGSPSLCSSQTAVVTVAPTNDAPVITSSAPTTATEDIAYNYTVSASDDSTNLVYSLGPEHTAGGSINSSTGAFTFTPASPNPTSPVNVSVRVCDNGSPSLCSSQTTTVTVLPGGPQTKDECKNGGWARFTTPTFKNQGACVSYVESNRS